MNCSVCGHVLASSAKFCKRCGSKQVLAPVDAPPDEISAPAAEKICGQCQLPCKPQARFCPQCGSVFAAKAPPDPPASTQSIAAIADSAKEVAASATPAASPAINEVAASAAAPTLSPAPAPQPGFVAPTADQTPDSAPVFPPEPQVIQAQDRKHWLKWAILALVVASVGGGVLLALNMGAFPGSSHPSTSPPKVDKNTLSPEDKARAESLLNAQSLNPQPADTSTLVSPQVDSAEPVAIVPAPSEAVTGVIAPSSSTAPNASSPPPVQAKPAPKPKPKPPSSGTPSLNDLLD